MRLWAIRIAVLATLVVVSLMFGPRAYAVLAATVRGPAPLVDLDRVGLADSPDWLRADPSLGRSVLAELSTVLRGDLQHGDQAAHDAVLEALRELSWVAAAGLRPKHPDQFELALELHRPVLEVVPVGPAAGKVPVVYVAATGRCLYRHPDAEPSRLPRCEMLDGPLPNSLPVFEIGKEHPDPRVLAAAATAEEWRTEFLAAFPEAPELVAVDASNLDYRLVDDTRYSEVRIVLRRQDGKNAVFGYGLSPGHPLPRLAVADKVQVLRQILAKYPGLIGVDKGDLRFVNLWENWLRPRPRRSGDPSTVPR